MKIYTKLLENVRFFHNSDEGYPYSSSVNHEREKVMKRLRTLLGGVLMFGLLAMIPMGCSDSDTDTSSSLQPNTYLILLSESGILELVDGQYHLVMENVSEIVRWYADRPSRQVGETNLQSLVNWEWQSLFGSTPPNAGLDCFVSGETVNDGFFITIGRPIYDAGSKTLIFDSVRLNGSSSPVTAETTLEKLKLTIVPNCGEANNCWSFVQLSKLGQFVPSNVNNNSGMKLLMEEMYPELYHIQHAPGTGFEILPASSLAENWSLYFGSIDPNASFAAYTPADELNLSILILSNPAYDDQVDTFSYDVTALQGSIEANVTYSMPTLFIDDQAGATIKIKDDTTGTIGTAKTRTLWIKPNTADGTSIGVIKAWTECVWDDGIKGCSIPIGKGDAGVITVPNPEAKHLNITFSLDGWPSLNHTEFENNVNDPTNFSNVDISLADGFNYNAEIKKDGVTIAGPTNGAHNNKDVTGVFPWGCSTCVGGAGAVSPEGDCKDGTEDNPTPTVCQVRIDNGVTTILNTFTDAD